MAGIIDSRVRHIIEQTGIGEQICFSLGGELDPAGESQSFQGVLKWKGRVLGSSGSRDISGAVINIQGLM